ncbi:MAG TPA: Glu/Leu/Phe/Val dehydrogenase dimerization domain-containing protein [Candidatus Binatia bacterium]|nr:Glu/Leu/Phe/Val dehydrogenase dimerization domain-containing protein [Candidatus Binatia bacterium]
MHVMRLRSVDGYIAFDLDDCRVNAGGTRLAPDVDEREARLLARAMTYKFAALGLEMGGAKAVIRGTGAQRAELMRRYCEEIRPMIEAVRFLTGPDIGTFEADFAPLRRPGETGVMTQPMEGTSFEDVLTGFGVVVAAQAALGTVDGATIAVEGFGKVGGGVSREAARRGAKVVALSTLAGCVAKPDGFDVETLWSLRARHGDALVHHLGVEVRPTAALFAVDADVLVPGARIGVIDPVRARTIAARVVAPAANVPYVAGTIDVLRERGIVALPDFICNAGAVIGYVSNDVKTHADMLRLVEERIGSLIRATLDPRTGSFAAGCAIAEEFLRKWRPAGGLPAGPPLA